jgi:hypothetical protein
MKKYLPFIISSSIVVVVVLLWDLIKLPYNQENLILGEYSKKQFNPLNEIVRFLFLIVIPVFIYLFYYLTLNKEGTFSIIPKNKDYFLSKEEVSDTNKLNFHFFFFISLISVEFFSLDFKYFISFADTYHDGPFLVHPQNYLFKGEFFRSTFYDYGFVANNIGLLPNFFLGYYTPGSIILVKLIFIYLNKFFLILISRKIISYLSIKISFKKLLFIIFTIFIVTLPDYYDHNSYFSPRSSLFLLFIFLLGSSLCDSKYSNLKNFVVGNFSLVSLLWWFDIGAYSNALIIVSMIYLLIHKETNKFIFLFLGVLFSWALFFLITPFEESKEFFHQLNFIYLTSDYLLGIEYLKPFSANSGRWTKALIMIYLTSIMLVNFNFNKEYKINYKTKIFTTLMLVGGIFSFKSALMRSDSHHLKYSSGLYTAVFVLICLIFIFNFIKKNIKTKDFFTDLKFIFSSKIIFIFSLVCSLFFILDFKNIKNIIYLKKNITTLVKAEDKFYLSKNYKLIIDRYKILSNEDECIQILTDDISFSYFLRKPTCTQFYNPSAQVINGITEEKFVKQLNVSSPKIILYKSPNNILLDFPNMPNALLHINKKYSFFENYNGYIFYKINE